MMFTDYLFIKILILIVVIIIISGGFYITLRFLLDAFSKEKDWEQSNKDELDFHYLQIQKHKVMEKELIEKIEKIRGNIDSLTKTYEDGIFLKKNIRIWQVARNLFQDLNNWKRTKRYPIDEEQVDYFLEDIVVLFQELGIELIRPKQDDEFDSRLMKIIDTTSNPLKQNHHVAEVLKYGYKLKLKNGYRILQEAEVIVYKN